MINNLKGDLVFFSLLLVFLLFGINVSSAKEVTYLDVKNMSIVTDFTDVYSYYDDNFKVEDLTDEYLKYDFSKLLVPDGVLGFIGKNYQRLHVNFVSVEKDKDDGKIYHVIGNTKVKNNSLDFEGEIEVVNIRSTPPRYGIDDIYRNKGIEKQGIFIGKYSFRENSKERYSGKFDGIMVLDWLMHKDLGLSHNLDQGDSTRNNQYEGKWVSYKTGISKVANWGMVRIPNSRWKPNSKGPFLDMGAAEFSVNPDYKKYGWE